MSKPKIILVAGPTAAGKSAFALDLAQKERGTVINADSMQIYAGLPILTAQPDEKAQEQAPHLLYGAVEPSEKSSAGIWLAMAHEAIRQTVAAGRTPILVGGTGLYFRALLGGLSDIPDVPEDVRKEAQELYDRVGEENFRVELAKLDPEGSQRFARNDRQRLIRAYEVARHTGKPIGHWQQSKPSSELEGFTIERHLIILPRDKLYAACDGRFKKMIGQGAVNEVRSFLERKLDPELPAMKTIGVREIGSYLRGEISLDEASATAQQMTRNYAKRQMTWFRNQWPSD